MSNIEDKITDAATSFGQRAGDVANDVRTHAKDAWDSVQCGTNRAVREGSAYVRENPVPTVLAALGVGLVLGLILSRHDPASFQDRYFAKPLHRSKGVLLGSLIACGTMFKRALTSASAAARNAGEELNDTMQPLKRAARRTGRKLGIRTPLLVALGVSWLLPLAPAPAVDKTGGGTFGLCINEKACLRNLVFARGQNIYTLDDTESFAYAFVYRTEEHYEPKAAQVFGTVSVNFVI